MNIEKMNMEDIDEISELENDLFTDPWPKHFFDEELNNELASYDVMREDGKIIAYAGMWRIFENCDLTNIAVRKEYQGQGLGEEMLRYMIREAINEGCEFMHLEVRKSNMKARRLYEKMGFTEVRTRKGYYENGEDGLDMVKGLLGLSEEDLGDRDQL